ncbi:hypothetical protein HIM_07151 [Hirsutella minnesotensis 3608]|uniref:CDP-alcohol phosphatidyltransferase class-I family protein C22A12.08c n=1 Tax=Hirsutella minnesotensis 3608 TaxID=1043627 RepID=A0A0F7ZZ00_9HYPO|nr:hypothetical protein HIM_07151 [Hirsutella minnesotensis 3608]
MSAARFLGHASGLCRLVPTPAQLLLATRRAPSSRIGIGAEAIPSRRCAFRLGSNAFAGQQRHRHDGPKPPPTPSKSPTAHTSLEDAASKAPAPAGKDPKQGRIVLHEDIYNIPNFLTATRLAAAPVIGYLVLNNSPAWAVGLFAYAAVTDMLDGWIARRWNRKTVVGTVLDPMADKALMTILTVCLAVQGSLPVWVASIILGRDVGLGISAIYYRWISLPPPKTFTRYWDFSLPSAEVHPTTISKYNTFLQLVLVGATTAAPLIDVDVSSALSVLQYVVAVTTVWSGMSYVLSKDAVKIIK